MIHPASWPAWARWVLIVAVFFLGVWLLGLAMVGVIALVYATVIIVVQQRRNRARYRAAATATGPLSDDAHRKLAEQSAAAIRAAEERDGKGL
jgi:hypothetical protein